MIKGFKQPLEKVFYGRIYLRIEKMKIGDSIDKESFIIELYGRYDYFIDRSFSVHFVKANKMLHGRKFITIDKKIVRLL